MSLGLPTLICQTVMVAEMIRLSRVMKQRGRGTITTVMHGMNIGMSRRSWSRELRPECFDRKRTDCGLRICHLRHRRWQSARIPLSAPERQYSQVNMSSVPTHYKCEGCGTERPYTDTQACYKCITRVASSSKTPSVTGKRSSDGGAGGSEKRSR